MEGRAKRSRLDDTETLSGRHAKKSRLDHPEASIEGEAVTLSLNDFEIPVEQHEKMLKLDDPEVPIERRVEELQLDDSEVPVGVPHKPFHSGSLFTALNHPLYVPLLRLPPEVRNHIWQDALHVDGNCIINEGEDFPEPALLSTCAQIRREAIGIFYSNNDFQAMITSYSPSMAKFLMPKLSNLNSMHNCGPPVMRLVGYRQGHPKWKNLVAWLKWIHKAGGVWCTQGPLPEDPTPAEVDYHEENSFINGLFNTAIKMRAEPWTVVEPVFVLLRYGLVRFDPEWAKD